jgi:hypothetical protein
MSVTGKGSHIVHTTSSQAAVWLSVLCTGHSFPSPQEHFLVLTPVRDWVNPMDALGKLWKLNYLIGNWCCYLPGCNIMLQPTMLLRVPGIFLGVRGVKCGWHIQMTTTLPYVSLISRKCGNLCLTSPGSPWPGTGTAFTFFIYSVFISYTDSISLRLCTQNYPQHRLARPLQWSSVLFTLVL